MKRILSNFTITLFLTGIPFHNSKELKSDKSLVRTKRLAGGDKASISEFPFFVSLITKALSKNDGLFPEQLQFCGGSIISDYWVITAATCMIYVSQYGLTFSEWFVRSGTSHWNATKRREKYLMDYDVEQFYYHFWYETYGPLSYNVALIKTKQIFKSPAERILIAQVRYKYKTGTDATIVGFGETKRYYTSKHLRKINVKLQDGSWCQKLFARNQYDRFVDPSEMLCAGSPNNSHNICEGDYGGALVQYSPRNHTPVLIGIASFGPHNCGNPTLTGVYGKTGILPIYSFNRIHKTGAQYFLHD